MNQNQNQNQNQIQNSDQDVWNANKHEMMTILSVCLMLGAIAAVSNIARIEAQEGKNFSEMAEAFLSDLPHSLRGYKNLINALSVPSLDPEMPQELAELLLSHPQMREAISFAIAYPFALGELEHISHTQSGRVLNEANS